MQRISGSQSSRRQLSTRARVTATHLAGAIVTTCALAVGVLAVPANGAAPVHGKGRAHAMTAPFVPCPIAPAPPLPGARPIPKPPSPPVRPPDAPIIGGEGLGTSGLVVPDGTPPLPHTLNAHGWVLADLDSGDVLAACAPHGQFQPASTQKLLTVLAALPKLDLKQVVTITDQDLNFEQGSSAVGLVKGGRYTVETILLGLLLNSGNDAANVIARLAGGPAGVAGTIQAMNDEAKRIGALDTTAVTPSGLDAPGQFTSAYDLALIARADFDRPDFRRYAATQRTVIPAQPPRFPSFQIQNDNRLLTSYPGALGGKTGFTDIARHTYVGAAQRNGRRLVVTLLRGEHRPQRLWQQGAALLDWGFALPRDAKPVGRLVTPGDLQRPQKESAGSGNVVPPAATLASRAGRANFDHVQTVGLALGGGTVGCALLMAGLMALRWRRNRRPGRTGLGAF